MLARAALAATILLAGCGGGSPGECVGPTQARKGAELREDFTAVGRIELDVRGAVRFHHAEDRAPVRVVQAPSEEIPIELRVANIGLEAPRSLSDGRGFRVFFDLLGYSGDGCYRFGPGIDPPRSGVPQPPGERFESDAVFSFWSPPGARIPTDFDRVREPCRVELSRGSLEGSLRCPGLADAGGETVSVLFSWSAPKRS